MWELFTHAGVVAYPLGVCSIVALAIILERLWTLRQIRSIEDRAAMILQLALEKRDDSMLKDPAIAAAPVTQIVLSLLDLRGHGQEAVRHAAELALALQRLRLRRYLGTLATIGSTAPFVGLFGTVIGIMIAFKDMGAAGGGPDSSVLMRGISEALSATALGLLVAVPSVVAYNYLLGSVQALLLQINSHLARLAPLLAHSGTPDRERVSA